MLALLLVVPCCFLVLFLVLLSVYEIKHCFPCNSGVCLKLSWLKCSLFFMFNVFVLAFRIYCVICLQSKQLSCIVLCLCCLFSSFVNKTKWFSSLHLVVLFLFWLFCVHDFAFYCFLFLSRNRPPKQDTAKKTNQNAEKKDKQKNQLAQLCSQIVFLILGAGYKNVMFCCKPYKKGV